MPLEGEELSGVAPSSTGSKGSRHVEPRANRDGPRWTNERTGSNEPACALLKMNTNGSRHEELCGGSGELKHVASGTSTNRPKRQQPRKSNDDSSRPAPRAESAKPSHATPFDEVENSECAEFRGDSKKLICAELGTGGSKPGRARPFSSTESSRLAKPGADKGEPVCAGPQSNGGRPDRAM